MSIQARARGIGLIGRRAPRVVPSAAYVLIVTGRSGGAPLAYWRCSDAGTLIDERNPALPLQGWGANVTGGEGGTVIPVTNNLESGAGSFRQAVLDANAAGAPRIIDIQVGGYIPTESKIVLTASDVTITGENAPTTPAIRGDATTLHAGSSLQLDGTDNILLTHLRLYRGLGAVGAATSKCIDFVNTNTNFAARFCSFAWADDELVTLWNNVHDWTFQYCMMYEGLYHGHHDEGAGFIPHSAMTITVRDAAELRGTFDKCVFAHSNLRMPQIGRGGFEQINCITYNFGHDTTDNWRGGTIQESPANIEKSIWISGNNTPTEDLTNPLLAGDPADVFVDDCQWIQEGFTKTTTDTDIVTGGTLASTRRTFTTPPPAAVTRLERADLWAHLKPFVGATLPARSATDARIINQIEKALAETSLDGTFIDNPADEDTNQNPSAFRTAYATWDDAL